MCITNPSSRGSSLSALLFARGLKSLPLGVPKPPGVVGVVGVIGAFGLRLYWKASEEGSEMLCITVSVFVNCGWAML